MVARTVLLTRIAQTTMNVDTLKTRNSDSLDFYDVAIWSIRSAVVYAYIQGYKHAISTLPDKDLELIDNYICKHTAFDTVETHNSDSLDFKNIPIWDIEKVLYYGYDLGNRRSKEKQK